MQQRLRVVRVMKFLIDQPPRQMAARFNRPIVAGQLQTPLTNYATWDGAFACDNGAFSGFDRDRWFRFLANREPHKARCRWVAMPDVVGNGRRTLELFTVLSAEVAGWPWALVAQDGVEDLNIPWRLFECLFIGGTTDWKMSDASADLIRTAKILGLQVHVGRVNTVQRYLHFARLGADTCDGTGIAKFDHMLAAIEQRIASGESPMPLFDRQAGHQHEGIRVRPERQ